MTGHRILFYVDTPSMMRSVEQAADILDSRLGADVSLLLVDSAKHATPDMRSRYSVYDYAELFHTAPSRIPALRIAREGRVHRARVWLQTFPARIIRSKDIILGQQLPQYIRRNYPRVWQTGKLAAYIAVRSRRTRDVVLQSPGPSLPLLIVLFPMVAVARAFQLIYFGLRGLVRVLASIFGPVLRLLLGPPYRVVRSKLGVIRRVVRSARGAVGTRLNVAISRVRASQSWHSLERARFWYRCSQSVRVFLRKRRPDTVVVLEDNIETLSRFFVEEARRAQMAVVVLPFTIPNPQEPAQFYQNDANYQQAGIAGNVLAALRPKWRYAFNGRNMLRMPASRAIGYELLGYSTPQPWVLNSGSADAIILDSAAMREAYLGLGFAPSQLKVIGEPAGDSLYEAKRSRGLRRENICQLHGWTDDRPLIVCGFPPNQFGSSGEDAFEFQSFDALAAAWMGALANVGRSANVLVRPHPRLNPELLRRHETDRVRITLVPTTDVIPLADLYVASISATIRWAIACGVPVINYDTYRYRYSDFAAASGVKAVESLQAFSALLDQFVEDRDQADAWRAQQAADAQHWGLVDPHFADRLAGLFGELAPKGSRRSVVEARARSDDVSSSSRRQSSVVTVG